MASVWESIWLIALTLLCGASMARADLALAATSQPSTQGPIGTSTPTAHDSALPQFLTEGWDVSVWGWLGYDYLTHNDQSSIWVAQGALDVTKTLTPNIAATLEVSVYDADSQSKALLEQAYVSILLSDKYQTMLTAGRFDANFGVEPRDYWNRLTGTASLLFGAQPQQLTGAMITQPLGTSGFKIQPFVTAGFQDSNVPGSPSVGVTLDYSAHSDFRISATNWFGPGFVWGETSGSYYESGNAVENWWGPSLDAVNGGSLYFFDAKAIWHPRPELTLCGEYLYANNFSSKGRYEWDGVMFLGNYDINDRFRVFGRWSFLNDPQWIVTANIQRRHEISAGLAYQFYHQVETRVEYRHDFSTSLPGQDIVSINLSFGF
jgi:hypothetical protein